MARAQLTSNLHGLTEKGRAGAANGLELGTEHALGISNSRVPIQEATLERSGVASVDRDDLVGAVSYDTDYAVVQHEDLTLRHDPGRGAKFLETALLESADEIAEILAVQVRRALR